MTAQTYTQDERRNIRPWVLAFCFFWGLVFGFLVYQKQDHSQVPPPEDKPVVKEEPSKLAEEEVIQAGEFRPPVNSNVTPPEPDDIEWDDVVVDESFDFRRTFGKEIPQTPPLTLQSEWGLTGITTAFPPRPIKPQPISPRASQTQPSFTTAPQTPITLDDIEEPELDDF